MVTLRPAQPGDDALVAEVWQAAWHDGHRGHVPDALTDARDPAYFQRRSAELRSHITVAVDDAELLGVLIVKDDELQQLMVSGARGAAVSAASFSPRPSARSPRRATTRSGWPWCPATRRLDASTRATAGPTAARRATTR